MISTPWQISCPANTIRGQLKHSWLENEILCTQSTNVVNRRADGSWEQGNKLATYLDNIDSTRKLADEMIQGFSPAQLVEQLGPLQKIPIEIRLKIKEAVHAAYLESSGMAELANDLKHAVDGFAQQFNMFITVWNEGNDNELRKSWQGVLKKAEDLQVVFEELPKGVVMP